MTYLGCTAEFHTPKLNFNGISRLVIGNVVKVQQTVDVSVGLLKHMKWKKPVDFVGLALKRSINVRIGGEVVVGYERRGKANCKI